MGESRHSLDLGGRTAIGDRRPGPERSQTFTAALTPSAGDPEATVMVLNRANQGCRTGGTINLCRPSPY